VSTPYSFRPHSVLLSTQPLTEIGAKNIPGVNHGRSVKLTSRPSANLHVSTFLKSPWRATGTTLPCLLPYNVMLRLWRSRIRHNGPRKQIPGTEGITFVLTVKNISVSQDAETCQREASASTSPVGPGHVTSGSPLLPVTAPRPSLSTVRSPEASWEKR
jgi:hypothetical protein